MRDISNPPALLVGATVLGMCLMLRSMYELLQVTETYHLWFIAHLAAASFLAYALFLCLEYFIDLAPFCGFLARCAVLSAFISFLVLMVAFGFAREQAADIIKITAISCSWFLIAFPLSLLAVVLVRQ